MRIFKMVAGIVLCLLCTAVLTFSGFFLLRAAFGSQAQPPEVLHTEDIFLEDEAEFVPQPLTEIPEEPEPEAPEIPEETPEPIPAPEEPSAAQTRLQAMTPEEKIWQLFITTPEQITDVNTATRAGEATQKALGQYPVGGLCYFADNLEDQEQAVEMLSKTQSYAKTKLFLCIDEEGGVVSRAGINEELNVTHLSPAAQYGASGDITALYSTSANLAKELMALGFNVNFAPVADLAVDGSTEIGDRAYSADPQTAASMVAAAVEGFQRQGLLSCLKHFPGHGSALGDSHEGESVSVRTVEQLRQNDWAPFRAGIAQNAAFVMLSHLINENISPRPADLSPEVVNFLRQELGFDGIVITDSHQMASITEVYAPGEAAVLALQAGADMILMPADLQAAYNGIKGALDKGELTWEQIDSSVLRILSVKYEYGILK